MIAEIITIGDELLLGYTTDANSAYVARKLAGIGYDVRYGSTVGDDPEAMEEAFRLALRRARVVITTGGLGPTDDDLTKRAIVKVFKRNLILHDDILETIRSRFAERGMEMPALSQNQALLPQGATFFANKIGSAVGICIAEEDKVFIALPGVPPEMQQIMNDEVVPYLSRLNTKQAIKVVTLRTTGAMESALSEKIASGLKLEPGVRLAYLPHYGSVDLRVIAQADTAEEAEAKASKLVRHVEKAVDRYIYGRDDDTLASVVGQLLSDNDKTLAVAESCTGGQLGMAITEVPGASNYFLGGVLAYSNEAKQDQLNVPEKTLIEHGAVSEECAVAMSSGCRSVFGSDYALSITGIAGPEGGTEEKPVGTTFIGLASAHTTVARRYRFGFERAMNRYRSVNAALEMLRREILDIGD